MDRRTDNLAEQLAQHTEGDEMIMMVIIRLRKVKSNKVGKKWPFGRFTEDVFLRKIGEVTHSELGTKVTEIIEPALKYTKG